MTDPEVDTNFKVPELRGMSLGVRARLLLAFLAITAFAVLAAAAGIYAFGEVGARLDLINTRGAPTLSALELSRSAERIVAAAPALLSATDRDRRDRIKSELKTEVERLNQRLTELKGNISAYSSHLEIDPIVTALTDTLAALEVLVAGRLEASERIRTLQRGVFQTNDETQRLLAPWIEVLGRQIVSHIENVQEPNSESPGENSARLTSLIESQRLTRTAQAQASSAVDALNQASTTEQGERLPILAFQLGLTLRDLDATASGLDLKLRPMFLEQVKKLRAFAEGPNAITEARKQELVLIAEGEKLLVETGRLSALLIAAVDQLGEAAKRDINSAILDALSVQQQSTGTLVALVALSLLTSVLVVWLYVGGNIVRRLTALSSGMLAISGGKLHIPVAVEGSDEIAAMGQAVEIFRRNAIDLERLLEERKETAKRLEQVVEERTRDLSEALQHKSHFLASASHDLRQPLHALNLFVAQLRGESDPVERARLVERVDAAIASMNELFGALLDMSKLEAGILEPNITAFPVGRVLERIETTFADAAREKNLRLAVVKSGAWVLSDFILLERILLNLVSNAVRYTERGRVTIGCRHRGGRLRIDVCDSGPGIPEEQQDNIFREYYQLGVAEPERRAGLGLGLAIVDRLGRLLDHEVELVSRSGRGSRFSVSVPRVAFQHGTAEAPISPAIADPANGKLVVVIDDDPLVLAGMCGILRSWGCRVVAADSEEGAVAGIAAAEQRPDLIIADYRLGGGKTGIEAIERLRDGLSPAVPAFLISGDTAPERLRDAAENGYSLLHKPVAPMQLRATVNQLLKASAPRNVAQAAK